VFYLSYARADHGVTNARFFDFFEELSENVAQLVSVPAGIGTGYMDRSIASGTQWTPELLNAIGTCQVFVALLSAPYINSLWCAQEWSAFSQREVVPRSGEAAQNTAIIPVIWAPFAEKVTPPTIDAIQRFSPNGLRDLDIVRQYHVYGMQGLMQAGLTGSYQTVVWELARQIATVHRSHWVRPQTFHENELHDIFRE
jgi:hypothetical protein